MQVKIKADATAPNWNPEFTKFLKDNADKFVKVETDYLFNDQYNTAKFRLVDAYISEVKNDVRINKGKCTYCGKTHTRNEQDKAQTCNNTEGCKGYKIEWFTPDNTYFLRYPKGAPEPVEIPEQMIGSYKFEVSYGFYWLRNNRKSYKFRYNPKEKKRFIVSNGIGYTQQRYLDIPDKAFMILLKVLDVNTVLTELKNRKP